MSLAQENFIQPTINSPGIYFDPIGSLKIVDGHLSVVIPLDTSFIKPHIDNLNSIIGTTKYFCKQSNVYNNSECHNMIQPLSTRYYDILSDFESISHFIENRSKRSAWFGGVGTVFKHLFGTMNEEDAIRYSAAIETVETDQTQLSKLLKDNILVTTTTLNSFKNVINKININEQQLNSAIDNLGLSLKNLTVLSDSLLFKSKLNEMLNILESSLLTLSFKLEDIVNGVMFSKSNILYPSVITPKQLFNELVENYRFLADFHQFPVKLSLRNIYLLLNISEIACYYNINKIVFVLKMPLVTSYEYNLYHSVPFPVIIKGNTTYSAIIPSAKYIGITRDRSFYCKLDDFNNCKTLYNFYYICEMLDIYSSIAAPICESEIVSKALTTIPNQCEIKYFQGHLEIWHRLYNNKWIYVITEKAKLSVDCNKIGNSELNIIGTGILSLPIDCIAYYKDLKLIPNIIKTIEVQHINFDFDLINIKDNLTVFKQSIKNLPFLKLKNNNLDSIISEHNKATTKIVNSLDNVLDKPHIVLYGEYYSYTTIFISILVIIFIIFIIYRYCKLGTCHGLLTKSFKKKLEIDKTEELSNSDVESHPVSAPKTRPSLT